MVLTVVIDRIENGNAILLAEEVGAEFSIPLRMIKSTYREGDVLSVSFDKDGTVELV